jgi:endogenous inhibitor of DNA gyrase (YacG/DUF329 family)
MDKPTCPNCKKPSSKDHAPFCCKRCREVDLNRWFSGSYSVAAIELDDIDDADIEQALAKQESI